jgi:hypothetical protein
MSTASDSAALSRIHSLRTDARNTYELVKLLVRPEFNVTEGELCSSSAAPDRNQGQPRLIASGDLAMR